MATHDHEDDETQERDPGLSSALTMVGDPPVPDNEGHLTAAEEAVVEDATQWLLSSFDENEDVEKTLDLNVGSTQKPRWIKWTIRAVEGPTLRKIRARASESLQRSSRGKAGALGDSDATFRANLELVVEGTVDPNVRELAVGRTIADPSIFVEEAFKNKQGLVDQIAAEIMSLSGYDDEDVRDSLELRAAGNS